MAVSVTHATAADGTFSASGATAWDEAHSVTGLGTMAEETATDYLSKAGNLSGLADAPTARSNLGLGTMATAAAADYAALAGATFTGAVLLPAGTASAPAMAFSADADGSGNGFYRRASNVMSYAPNGTGILEFSISGLSLASSYGVQFLSGALGSGGDAAITRAAANSLQFASTTANVAGAATSRTEINKAVPSIADATATTVFTVTVPNAAHSANIEVTLNGSLGAGGAIGADESGASIKYNVMVNRTAGLNAVPVISAAYGSSGSAGVTGADTCTVAGDLGAVSGAAGATNTFTIRVTITRGGGTSTNHTCTAHAVLLNRNASGVTIA